MRAMPAPEPTPERIEVLEIRENQGGREFLVTQDGGGHLWVDALTLAQDILNEEYSFFIATQDGGDETFHVVLQRDGSWNVDHYPDAEVDWDDVVLMEA
jgi:hypothetical protein